jgi:hypothetical protein
MWRRKPAVLSLLVLFETLLKNDSRKNRNFSLILSADVVIMNNGRNKLLEAIVNVLQTTRLGHRRFVPSSAPFHLSQAPNKKYPEYRIPHPVSSLCFKISQGKTPAHSMAPPKKHSGIKPLSSKTAAPPPPPNWPAFKPLVPSSDLTLTTLIPSQIVLIRNFWTSKLCRDYVSFLRELPLVTTPGKPKKGDAVRVNDRFQVTDEGFARRLWEETGLRGLVLGEGEEGGGERMSESERSELW